MGNIQVERNEKKIRLQTVNYDENETLSFVMQHLHCDENRLKGAKNEQQQQKKMKPK